MSIRPGVPFSQRRTAPIIRGMRIQVSPAAAKHAPERSYDVYVAPSGVRYLYSEGTTLVVGTPTDADEISFVRHAAARRAFAGTRVLGVNL